MSRFKEYDQYDGLGLAELVRNGEVTALELFDEAVYRYEKTHSAINAVTIPMLDRARQQVENFQPNQTSGVFAGVPLLIKNLLTEIHGTEITNGSAALKGNVSQQTSELAKRYLKSGVTLMGRTNTSEFGLVGFTEPKAYGPTRNPWNLEYSVGGSSGGSAAAVAARIVPLAGGGDGGVSIRIPAACCGLFGLKPTRGRIPTAPIAADYWDGAASEHVITLSVRDSAAMLDITHGPAIGEAYSIPTPERKFSDIIKQPLRRLKIGFTYHSPVNTAVDFECISATQKAVRTLEHLGHHVEEVEFPVDGQVMAKAFFMLYFGQVAADLQAISEKTGIAVKRLDVEDLTYTFGLLGRKISADTYINLKRTWNDMSQSAVSFHKKYDLLLTPTLGLAPPKIGDLQLKLREILPVNLLCHLGMAKHIFSPAIFTRLINSGLAPYPFTQVANLTGQPAMSVPLHWTGNGLPCGVQFVAPMGDEATLLQLATELEIAEPWFDKRPTLVSNY